MTQIIIGDGWAALGATAYLLRLGKEVCWIAGSGTRLIPPLPTVASGEAARAWAELARAYGIDIGSEQPGSFLREFRNKSFREPTWARAAEPEARAEIQREVLWAAERFLMGAPESRFEELTPAELEEALRAAVLVHPNLQRIEAIPVESFATTDGQLTEVVLSSGARVCGAHVIFADSWEELPRIIGASIAAAGASSAFPPAKTLAFLRKREPMGALQATFHHSQRIGEESPILEGFFSSLHRETGEDFDRHLIGHFSSDGMRSHWTLCLAEAEAEDNHEIAKRLRRMKTVLEKMFSGTPWVSAKDSTETASFLGTVKSEQVRFAEGVLFAEGEPLLEPATIPSVSNLVFLTDGYGPSHAIELARKATVDSDAELFLPQGASAEAVGVDLESGLS